MPALLKGLQFIFKNVELRTRIMQLLENQVMGDKPTSNGRPGMDLWQILVLGVLRVGLDCDYDRIEHIANYDTLVRQILGVPAMLNDQVFHHRTISDNVCAIDEEFMMKINAIVVEYGLPVLKKKADEKLEVKTDSFVLEANVHYPTDANLLWDAIRKSVEVSAKLSAALELPGWRKAEAWLGRAKGAMRTFTKAISGGGANKEKRGKEAAKAYLDVSGDVNHKVLGTILSIEKSTLQPAQVMQLTELKSYQTYLEKFRDQIKRRVILGEIIPHAEKVFSIFEPHVELIKKGKVMPPIEFGHRILVSTEQRGFIVDYKVMGPGHEGAEAIPVAERLAALFGKEGIQSLSFDKGFSSAANLEQVQNELPSSLIVMPKKGRRNAAETERETDTRWKRQRKRHSAVESDINSLEHHGLRRCRDKGERGFRRYAGLGVLAYNLDKIGAALQKAEEKKKVKKPKPAKVPKVPAKAAA